MLLKYNNHNSKLYPQSGVDTPFEEYVKIGSMYVPYGILFWGDFISYAVLLEDGVSTPVFLAEDHFEVINNHISKYFVLGKYETFHGVKPFLSFPEWANDISYVYKITDGEINAMAAFDKYKILLANETPL